MSYNSSKNIFLAFFIPVEKEYNCASCTLGHFRSLFCKMKENIFQHAAKTFYQSTSLSKLTPHVYFSNYRHVNVWKSEYFAWSKQQRTSTRFIYKFILKVDSGCVVIWTKQNNSHWLACALLKGVPSSTDMLIRQQNE